MQFPAVLGVYLTHIHVSLAVDFAVNSVMDFHDHLNLPSKATANLRNSHGYSLRNCVCLICVFGLGIKKLAHASLAGPS